MNILQRQVQDEPLPHRPKYKGESSRTPLTRASQHLEAYRKKDEKSFMYDHTVKEHGGVVGGSRDYVLTVTATDRDPVRRVLREAVRIRSAVEGREETFMDLSLKTHLLNDKQNEWFGAWMMAATMTDL
jgi:hypothetical protein